MKRREEGQDLSRARERVSEQLQKEKRASERANSRSLRFWQTHSPPLFSLSHPPSTGRLHAREYHCLLALPQSLLIIMLYTDGERSEGGSREGKGRRRGQERRRGKRASGFLSLHPHSSLFPPSSLAPRLVSASFSLSIPFTYTHSCTQNRASAPHPTLYSYSFAHSRISPLFPLSPRDPGS